MAVVIIALSSVLLLRKMMIEKHKRDLSNEADIRFCVRTKFVKEEEVAREDFQMECDELKNKVREMTLCLEVSKLSKPVLLHPPYRARAQPVIFARPRLRAPAPSHRASTLARGSHTSQTQPLSIDGKKKQKT